MSELLPDVGLCSQCMHSRRIESAKGSRFWLCTLSEHDARFPRYPRLPVMHCDGYTARSESPPNDTKH